MPNAEIEAGILTIVSCLTILLSLTEMINIFPLLLGSVISSREPINIHSSAVLRRARNRVTFAMMPSFILVVYRYGLYPPAESFEGWIEVAVICAVFAAWVLLRLICTRIFRDRNMRDEEYFCAAESPRVFFILTSAVMFITSGVCDLFSVSQTLTHDILQWEIIVGYSFALLRKTQIFAYYRGIFAGFLYLCTLELIPTGILILTVVL